MPSSVRVLVLGMLVCLGAHELVAQPATQVLDIWPGSSSSTIRQIFGASFGTAFFVADDGTNGRELWISDGTPAGTQLVDICPGACASYLLFSNPEFVEIGGTVFFTADYAAKRVYFASRAQAGGSDKTPWCIDFTASTVGLCWSEALGDIDGSPVLRTSVVYVGDNAGNVLARNAGTGAPCGRFRPETGL